MDVQISSFLVTIPSTLVGEMKYFNGTGNYIKEAQLTVVYQEFDEGGGIQSMHIARVKNLAATPTWINHSHQF